MCAEANTRDVGPTPPTRVRAPLMLQRWDTVGFVHWRYERGLVQDVVPRGLEVEEYDGSAWVSLTPFIVRDARLPFLPPLPSMRQYGETNLRTYVQSRDGHRGIWFHALDSSNVPSFVLGRTAYLQPYVFSDLSVSVAGAEAHFTGKRRFPHAGSGYDVTLRIGDRCVDGGDPGLDQFLTGRWLFFTRLGRLVAKANVSHQPWPLHDAEVVALSEDVTRAAGLPEPPPHAVAHFSLGVDARLGPPRPLLRS
jgi:uncharacterized protein YqjF (DUF2071 family)